MRNCNIAYADNNLRWMDTPGDNFCDYLLALLNTQPFLKRGLHLKDRIAPMGSKFFPFQVQPSSEGRQNDFVTPETVSIPLNPESAKKNCIWNCHLFMSSAEYSCELFKPIFAYRQTVGTQIRLRLQKWLLKSQADDKADDNCCDWQLKG